jgi:hypothetical protein
MVIKEKISRRYSRDKGIKVHYYRKLSNHKSQQSKTCNGKSLPINDYFDYNWIISPIKTQSH